MWITAACARPEILTLLCWTKTQKFLQRITALFLTCLSHVVQIYLVSQYLVNTFITSAQDSESALSEQFVHPRALTSVMLEVHYSANGVDNL